MKNIYLTLVSLFIVSLSFGQGSGSNLEFNGSSSYVSCGTVNLSGSALTMMGWIKADQFNNTTGGAAANIASLWGTEAGGTITLLRLGDGGGLAKEKVQFVLYINGRPTKLNGNKSLTTGRWYHLAATYDGSTMRLYIDGELDASMSASGPNGVNNTFTIGQNYDPARTFDGQMDEISVWKAALSQNTIRAWMCQSITSGHPNYSNLEAYWKMDQGSGATITDHSGNSHTGTLLSSPTWQTSSAPIGDISVSDYSSPFSLNLVHPDGDTMTVSNVSGSPNSVHLYRVDAKPNSANFPTGTGDHDTTRYWGVWFSQNSSTPTASIKYSYPNNSYYNANGTCLIDLARRNDNAVTSWTALNSTQSVNDLTKTGQGRSEYILTFRSNKTIHKDTSGVACFGDSVRLNNASTGLNYTWYRNNTVIQGATSNTYFAKQPGTYQLVVGTGTCSDTTNTFSLTTRPKLQVTFDPLPASCASEKFDTITGGSPAGGVYQHRFMSGNVFVVSSAGAGNHVIYYNYTDKYGCSASATQVKVVHPTPNVTLGHMQFVCLDSAAFNLSGGSPAGGTYYINGVAGSTFDASAQGVGSHAIKYEVTDTNGCKGSQSRNLIVAALPNVSFSLTTDSACEGTGPIAIGGHMPTGGTFSGVGVKGMNFESVAAGVGEHAITYSYTNLNGCSNTAIDTFTVNPKPTTPTITESGDSLLSSLADTYQWYNVSGALSGETRRGYKPAAEGLYRVVVTDNGCVSDTSNAFDWVIEDTATGLTSITLDASIRMYPNPANDRIYFDLGKKVSMLDVKVYDLNSKMVLEERVLDSRAIQVGHLESGNYILEVATDVAVKRDRLVIQH